MGGCRCSFRDCKVNTSKQNRMHFFHYPLKRLERFQKWREYSQNEMMMSYSEVKKKNMVVCARHFRIECFMNYKMDRLTASAIPTLMRLSKTQALDFEEDVNNGVLITLEGPKQNHLIAPKNFECPLDLDTDQDLFDKLKELENERTVEVPAVEDYDEYTNTSKGSYSIIQMKSQDVVEYVASEDGNYDHVQEKPLKSSSNKVEILETIQVSATHSKRPPTEAEEPVCKRRVLNSIHTIDTNHIAPVIVPFTEESSQPVPEYEVGHVVHIPTLVQNELIDQDGNPILAHDIFNDDDDDDDDDDNVEVFEIHDEDDLTTIVQLKTDIQQDHVTALELMKTKLSAAQQETKTAKELQVKLSILEKENVMFKETLQKYEDIKKKLFSCQLENARMKNSIKDLETLKDELKNYKNECEILKQNAIKCSSSPLKLPLNKKIEDLEKTVNSYKESNLKEKELNEVLELELNDEREKHFQTETKLLQQVTTLEQSLELSRTQITTTKNNMSLYKSNINDLQLEKLNLNKQRMEIEESLQALQHSYDTLNQEHLNTQVNYDCLQQKYSNLEHKYMKLEALQNQVATVTTSHDNIPKACPPSQVVLQASASSLTKAQLFNAIKRYLSASMVSLLRMEMFGSSEREWKSDERQVAVDLLRLGENVYKYITDEWRFRLPSLRDVRNWLSQSVAMEDEDDL